MYVDVSKYYGRLIFLQYLKTNINKYNFKKFDRHELNITINISFIAFC